MWLICASSTVNFMVNDDGYYIYHIWLMMVFIVSGWWLTDPSEKYEFVNWKDDISYMKWKIKKPV